LSHIKPQETFLRLCMEQREALTVYAFSVLSGRQEIIFYRFGPSAAGVSRRL